MEVETTQSALEWKEQQLRKISAELQHPESSAARRLCHGKLSWRFPISGDAPVEGLTVLMDELSQQGWSVTFHQPDLSLELN